MNYNDGAVARRKAAIIFIQEHKLKGKALGETAKRLKEANWTWKCGPCDENTKKPNAGVGVMIDDKQGCKIIDAKVYTEDFKKACKAGRAAIYEMDLGWESNMLVFEIYGVAGGSKAARAATEAIVDAIVKEKDKRPYMPTMILGDFNAEPDSLKAIQELIAEEQWTDVGRHASRWGGEGCANDLQDETESKALTYRRRGREQGGNGVDRRL